MEDEDVCRVCRAEGTPDNALFHPCACTGSIKFVHQACLVQWLKHSRKEYCELCKHRFLFRPIYAANTPSRLPLREIVIGLLRNVGSVLLRTVPPLSIWAIYIPLLAANAYRARYAPDGATQGDAVSEAIPVPVLSDIVRVVVGYFALKPHPGWSLPAVTNSITTGMLVMMFAIMCFCLLFIFLPLLELYGGDWLVVNPDANGNLLRRLLLRNWRRVPPAPPVEGRRAAAAVRAQQEQQQHDGSDADSSGEDSDGWVTDTGTDSDNGVDESENEAAAADDDNNGDAVAEAAAAVRNAQQDRPPLILDTGRARADFHLPGQIGDDVGVGVQTETETPAAAPRHGHGHARVWGEVELQVMRQRRLDRFLAAERRGDERDGTLPPPQVVATAAATALPVETQDPRPTTGQGAVPGSSASIPSDAGGALATAPSAWTSVPPGSSSVERATEGPGYGEDERATEGLADGEDAVVGSEQASLHHTTAAGTGDLGAEQDFDGWLREGRRQWEDSLAVGRHEVAAEAGGDLLGDVDGPDIFPRPLPPAIGRAPGSVGDADPARRLLADDGEVEENEHGDRQRDIDDGGDNVVDAEGDGVAAQNVALIDGIIGLVDMIEEFRENGAAPVADIDSDSNDDDDDDEDFVDTDSEDSDEGHEDDDDDAVLHGQNANAENQVAPADVLIENNVMDFLERDQGVPAAAGGEDGNVNVHRIFRLLGFEGGIDFLLVALVFYLFITLSLDAIAAPTRLGRFILTTFNHTSTVRKVWLESTVPLAIGYIPLSMFAFLCNWCARVVGLRHLTWFFGAVYLSCKVIVLLLVELIIFPQLCGFWLHICCLGLLGDTAEALDQRYVSSATSFCFVHWILGMEFLYFFASFVIVSRKVLRPGVLWFFRNLNDPNFHPMEEIMTAPILIQVRHFLTSSVFLGTSILLITWIPIKIVKWILPSFLPFVVSNDRPADTEGMYVDVAILHFILAVVFDNRHTRFLVHGFVYLWCHVVARLLGLRSYLLGLPQDDQQQQQQQDEPVAPGAEQQQEQPGVDDAAAAAAPARAPDRRPGELRPLVFQRIHELARQDEVYREREDYVRPSYFLLRILALVSVFILSVIGVSLFIIAVPALTGRALTSLFFPPGERFEGYTIAVGLKALWLFSKLAYAVTVSVCQYGVRGVQRLMATDTLGKILYCLFFFFLTFGLLSFLVGMAVSLMAMPLVVLPNQTPTFPFHYTLVFIFGFGITNFAVTLLVFAHLDLVEGAARDHRNMFLHLLHIITVSDVVRGHIINAVLSVMAFICVPYTLTLGPLKLLGASLETQTLVMKNVYFLIASAMFAAVFMVAFASSLYKACITLHANMKKERYLNGFQLMNYEPQR
eukprot:scpid28246/ scgid10187/ E3 ubiquitin-protein ligase MARCH6; Membrane-associated RING finger protein 6; Membrane-associated RING-CH protein VI